MTRRKDHLELVMATDKDAAAELRRQALEIFEEQKKAFVYPGMQVFGPSDCARSFLLRQNRYERTKELLGALCEVIGEARANGVFIAESNHYRFTSERDNRPGKRRRR